MPLRKTLATNMIYYANPTTHAYQHMRAGRIGYIDTPTQGNRRPHGSSNYLPHQNHRIHSYTLTITIRGPIRSDGMVNWCELRLQETATNSGTYRGEERCW